MSEPRKLSTVRNIIPVEIDDKQYIVKEASGEVGRNFRNKRAASAQIVGENLVTFKDPGDLEPWLVSQCLFEVAADGTHIPVKLTTILAWTDAAQRALFEMAKEISPSLNEIPDRASLHKERERIEKALKFLDDGGKPGDDAKN